MAKNSKWNYPKIMLFLLGLIVCLSIISFGVMSLFSGTIQFESNIELNSATEKEFIKDVKNFESIAITKPKAILKKYNFTYERFFKSSEKYEFQILEDFKFFGIKRLKDKKVKYYKNKGIYKVKEFLNVYKALPKPEIKLSKKAVKKGEINYLKISKIKGVNDLSLQTNLDNGKYKVFPEMWPLKNNNYIVYLPSYYDTPSQTVKLKVKYETINGKESKELVYDIKDTKFDKQNLTITEDKVTKNRNKKAREQHEKVLKEVLNKNYNYNKVTTSLLNFKFPIKVGGPLTTSYGTLRYVNNIKTPYTHSGIDMAASKGVNVLATENGKVVFSGILDLTGNTVIIYHGYNMFSIYYHMNSRVVKKDDIVKQFQKIGEVGSTGFSSGNHIHFEISYKDIRLMPGMFILGEQITKNNWINLFNKR